MTLFLKKTKYLFSKIEIKIDEEWIIIGTITRHFMTLLTLLKSTELSRSEDLLFVVKKKGNQYNKCLALQRLPLTKPP